MDVFFVISGYLISSILIREINQGRFSIARFYYRRMKRIFPALIAVLSFMLALGWLIQFSVEFKKLGQHVAGGVAFVANFQMLGDTGYFAAGQERQPLLHLWSLGVEEQFYIFFPLLLWALSRRNVLRVLTLTSLLCASFVLSFYWTPVFPDVTFFLPVTRGWELMIGCVLASVENGAGVGFANWARKREWLANGMSALGLVSILTSAVCVTGLRPFPGAWALMPTLGALLMIWAGPRSWCNRWVLSNRIMVGVGLISYPLYLWHWPLLYCVRTLMPEHVPAWGIAGAVFAAFALSVVTFRYIERPIRFGGGSASLRVMGLCGAMLALFVIGQLALRQTISPRLASHEIDREVCDAVGDWGYPFHDNYMRPDLCLDAQIDNGAVGSTVLFIGDSHMQHYWPRVEWNLTNAPGKCRPAAFLTCSGSPTLPGVNRVRPGNACDEFFAFAVKEASKPEVGTVVFVCFWESYFKGAYPDVAAEPIYRVDDPARTPLRLGTPATREVFAQFGQVVRRLSQMGKEVIVITSSPTARQWNPRSAPRFGSEGPTNALVVERKDFEAFIAPVRQLVIDAVVPNGGKIIDPLDYFDEQGRLNGKTPAGHFRYKDSNHLRPFYAREKALFLDPLIRADLKSAQR